MDCLMKVNPLNVLLISFVLVNWSCGECSQYLSEPELQFVAYARGQTMSLRDTNNVVHPMEQIKYRRELFESCGSIGCSNEHSEVYEIEYRSSLDQAWGFSLQLYAPSCGGNSEASFFISSDNLKSYQADRWIFSIHPDEEKIKYPTIDINGSTFENVYEFSGYYNNAPIIMLFNHQFGILQITFPRNKAIALMV